jgi:hypothetical protein
MVKIITEGDYVEIEYDNIIIWEGDVDSIEAADLLEIIIGLDHEAEITTESEE